MNEIIKIAIIHGNTPVDGVNKNGQIDYINCTLDDEYFHIALMLKYLENNYKDNETLQKYNAYTSINKIAITLSDLGEIVFLNTTTYRKDILEKNGRSGILIVPSSVTDEQKNGIFELKEKISKFNEIQIWYDIQEDFSAKMLIGNPDIIDEFYKTKTR